MGQGWCFHIWLAKEYLLAVYIIQDPDIGWIEKGYLVFFIDFESTVECETGEVHGRPATSSCAWLLP